MGKVPKSFYPVGHAAGMTPTSVQNNDAYLGSAAGPNGGPVFQLFLSEDCGAVRGKEDELLCVGLGEPVRVEGLFPGSVGPALRVLHDGIEPTCGVGRFVHFAPVLDDSQIPG